MNSSAAIGVATTAAAMAWGNRIPDITAVKGKSQSDVVDSPSLVLHLDALERNMAFMKQYATKDRTNLILRPHFKLHKCSKLAKMQIEQGGATGVCCQKVSEAAVLVANDAVRDIFISNEIVDKKKLTRAVALADTLCARDGGRLAICVDSVLGVERLAEAVQAAKTAATIAVLVEVNVGQNRSGVEPASPELLDVMGAVLDNQKAGLRFGGIHAYHGAAQHIRKYSERKAVINQTIQWARESKDLLEKHFAETTMLTGKTQNDMTTTAAFRVPLVTGAGTGTFSIEGNSGLYGEIQPGSYLVNDKDYADNEDDHADGECHPRFEHALFIKTQVCTKINLPNSTTTKVVLDAGHKSAAIDSGLPGVWHPSESRLLSSNEVTVLNGGDDHTVLEFSHSTGSPSTLIPNLGDTVWLVPNHCDPTFNLHDFAIGVRGASVEESVVEDVLIIDARGCQM